MKKTIVYLLLLILSISCNKNKTTSERLTLAKQMVTKIVSSVEYADTEAITKEELNKIAIPLQDKLDSLKIEMEQWELDSLDAYRTKIVSEMIDRKVLRDN